MIYVIVAIAVIVILSIAIGNSKDKQDLNEKTLLEKFNVIVAHLTEFAFDKDYVVRKQSDKHIFLMHNMANNHMIELLYNQGVLTIIWKYKYFQKELVFKKHLTNVRNLSLIEQDKIGQSLVDLMNLKIIDFQKNTLRY